MPNRPLLPFGHARANLISSESVFVSALQQAGRPVDDFAFRGPERSAAVVGLQIGGLTASAAMSDAMHAKCLAQPQITFILPVAGACRIIHSKRSIEWSANKSIVSNSYYEPLEVSTAANTIVTLRPNLEKLQAALASILRDTSAAGEHRAQEICERLLTRGPHLDTGGGRSVDYWEALMKLVALFQECDCDGELLQRIGVEDVVNRLLARLVLEQEDGTAAEEPRHTRSRSVKTVDVICEHIRSTIGRPLSISDMEALTGLTGRALNYAFRARHGCSPQEWQRGFLLDHARSLLRARDYTGSVKTLAYELGFASPSSFSAFYKQRFGELPSRTALRAAPMRPTARQPAPPEAARPTTAEARALGALPVIAPR